MEVSFKTKAVRTLCEQPEVATAHLGIDVARMLMNRLADLSAAESIDDVLAGQKTMNGEVVELRLCGKYALTLSCGHFHPPLLSAGGIDWPKVSRIRVDGIKSDDE